MQNMATEMEDVSRHSNICLGCSAHRNASWGGIPYIACVPAEKVNGLESAKPNMTNIPRNCPNNFVSTATGIPVKKSEVQ